MRTATSLRTIATFSASNTFEKSGTDRGLLTIGDSSKGDLMASDPQAHDRNQSRKRRRPGYRGYGSPLRRIRADHDGDFHSGLGFAGLGPSSAGGGVLPHATVIPDGLRESLSPKNT